MYEVIEEIPSVDDFLHLQQISGLTPRTRAAAEKGLPNSLYGVVVRHGGKAVAMGRIVGDGALNFEIVDIAGDPGNQRRSLGSLIMQTIMDYLEAEAPTGAYITLMADVPALYEKFGFALSRPNSEGMFIIK